MEDGGLHVLMLLPPHDMAQVPPEIFLGPRLVLPSRVAACKHSVTFSCFQESPPPVTHGPTSLKGLSCAPLTTVASMQMLCCVPC